MWLKIKILLILIYYINTSQCQTYPALNQQFTIADTLRGSLNPLRSCLDIVQYDLSVKFDIKAKSIAGYNTISFDMLESSDHIQLDLFENMVVDRISYGHQKLDFRRLGNVLIIDANSFLAGQSYQLTVEYHGTPTRAQNPPWDGGFIWKQDRENRPFISVACEGLGASSWWPNKDHLSDEPNQMNISLIVPSELKAISNGQLIQEEKYNEDYTTYSWHVSYPINNYNVTFYLGHYVHFSDSLIQSELDKPLQLNYYVLDYNLAKAKKHFKQSKEILKSFEHYLGAFPFSRDGFALVEAPFLGMEHQSAIAYGNNYLNGYLGGGIPSDMAFDYLILHEAGHEYWGNSVSVTDHGEVWIHEAFATYMESLYIEFKYGLKDAVRYLNYQRPFIENKEPLVGPFGVNYTDFSTSDMYYKGSWLLHTLRSTFNSNSEWFEFFRSFYDNHKYGFVNSENLITEIEKFTGRNYRPILDHYLFTCELPLLEYTVSDRDDLSYHVHYRWQEVDDGFNLMINLDHWGINKSLSPSKKWQSIVITKSEMDNITDIRERYLIDLQRVNR